MTKTFFRNSMGIASLSALALTMVACGGSSSSTPAPVVPVNNAPRIAAISPNGAFTSMVSKHSYAYNVVASDPDGDTFTYSTTATGVTFSGNTMIVSPAAAAAAGSTISVIATDSKAAPSPAFVVTLPVISADSQPSAAGITVPAFVVGGTAQVTLPGSDVDGDAYFWSLDTGSTYPAAKVSVSNNVLSLDGAAVVFGSYTVKLKATQSNGTYPIVASAKDVAGMTVNITVNPPADRAAVWTSVAPTAGREGIAISYPLMALDPDGDAVTYAIVSAPSGAVLSGSNLNWTPNATQTGVQAFRLSATSKGANASTNLVSYQDFVVVVAVNQGPVFAQGTSFAASTRDGEFLSFNLSATDPNADVVTLSSSNLPAWLTLTPTGNGTATISGRPPVNMANTITTAAFTVVASDATGLPDGKTNLPVVITINVNQAPALAIATPSAIREEDGLYTLTPASFLTDGDQGSSAAPTIVSVVPDASNNAIDTFTFAGGALNVHSNFLSTGPLGGVNRSFGFTVNAIDALGKTVSQHVVVPITARTAPTVNLATGNTVLVTALAGGNLVEGKTYPLNVANMLGDAAHTANSATIAFAGSHIPAGLTLTAGVFSYTPPIGTTTESFQFSVTDPTYPSLTRTYTANIVVTASINPAISVAGLTFLDEGVGTTKQAFTFSATTDPASAATIALLSYDGVPPAGVLIAFNTTTKIATVTVDQSNIKWSTSPQDDSETAHLTLNLRAVDTNNKIGTLAQNVIIHRTPKPIISQGLLSVRAGNTFLSMSGAQTVGVSMTTDAFGTTAANAYTSLLPVTATVAQTGTNFSIGAATSLTNYGISFNLTGTTTRLNGVTRTSDVTPVLVTAVADSAPALPSTIELQPLAPGAVQYYTPAVTGNTEGDALTWQTLVPTTWPYGTTMTQDTTTGQLTITAGASAGNARSKVTVYAIDSHGQASNVQDIFINFSNTLPVIQPPATTGTAAVGHALNGGNGLSFNASDPDRAYSLPLTPNDATLGSDAVTWSVVETGSLLGGTGSISPTGVFTWTPTSQGNATFHIHALDSKNLALGASGIPAVYTLNLVVTPDNKPNFRVQTITEQIEATRFHDEANLRGQIDAIAKGKKFTSQDAIDSWTTDTPAAIATALAFSDLGLDPISGTLLRQSAGWRAGILADDPEKDVIRYFIKPNSVYFNGAPFTMAGRTNNIPALPAGPTALNITFPPETLDNYPTDSAFSSVVPSEYPTIDPLTGEVTWTPIRGVLNIMDPQDKWSFTVLAVEYLNGVPVPDMVSQYNATELRVERNTGLNFDAVTTILNSTNEAATAGDVALSLVSIGGGTNSLPFGPGRPSIQEPLSRPYDVAVFAGVAGYPYDTKYSTTAKWRWALSAAGGTTWADDSEIFDTDTLSTSGHIDAYEVRMGLLTSGVNYPAVDTTGNFPAMTAEGGIYGNFYNPWIPTTASYFEVFWGPARTQYLIARFTSNAGYSFPVEAHEQYSFNGSANLPINPMFGTVRFADSRNLIGLDQTANQSSVRGIFLASANEGDNRVNAASQHARYTFTYLPLPSGIDGLTETNVGPNLFNLPASVTQLPASGTDADTGAGRNYLGTSWITLRATETEQKGFHTANPLNDEITTFNKNAYAQANIGGYSTAAWRVYKNPATPTYTDFTSTIDATSSTTAGNEARAQVIPSNSPYLFSIRHNNRPADGYTVPATTSAYFGNFPNEIQGNTLNITPIWYNNTNVTNFSAGGWYYGVRHGELDVTRAIPGRSVTAGTGTPAASGDTLRWTYTWPSSITQTNLGKSSGTNKFEQADVMQMVVPNMGANGRWFFSGDSATQGVSGWGTWGMADATDGYLAAGPYFGLAPLQAPTNTVAATGFTTAGLTPLHVVTNSIWVPAQQPAAIGVPTDKYFNIPASTNYSAGVGASQLPFTGVKGYASAFAAGDVADPSINATIAGIANPARINLSTTVDRVYYIWMKNDATISSSGKGNAWGTWGASVLKAGAPNSATGGTTTAAAFSMSGVQYDTLSQISMATGNLPGTNQAQNFGLASAANTSGASFTSWDRNQFALMAPAMGSVFSNGVGLVSNVRLVNPVLDAATTALGGSVLGTTAFSFFGGPSVGSTTDGGIRDSAVIYAIKNRTPFGLMGLEPSSPVLAQWHNLQETAGSVNDVTLEAATTVNSVSLVDVAKANFPLVFQNFYSPFVGQNDWKHVLDLKVNYVAGVMFPMADNLANTVWKVPVTIEQLFPLDMGVITDPTCTNAGNIINAGQPIVTPVRFARINDYVANTRPGAIRTKLDLVNSWASSMTGTGIETIPTGLPLTLNAYSTVTLQWQASVNNQVLPSGYILELYQIPDSTLITQQPILLGSYRTGHIGVRDAWQVMHLPAMHSVEVPQDVDGNAAYFFKIKTVWSFDYTTGERIDMERSPYKQSIPYANADFITSVFVTE